MNALKVVALALVAISAIAAVQGEELECPKICPDLYLPTCATNGKDFEKFDNPCALSVFNCNRQRSALATYSETDIDWCTTTELDELNDDLQTDVEEADVSCMKPCPMIYNPVCGSNGTFRKMFSNECEMNMFSCLYKAKAKSVWRILKTGKCLPNSDE